MVGGNLSVTGTGGAGGWVKLSETSASAAVTTVNLETGFDDTNYTVFRVIGERVRGAPGNLFYLLKVF